MTKTHEELLRALIAAQVAVIEHADEDVQENVAIMALDKCIKEIIRLNKKLKREE